MKGFANWIMQGRMQAVIAATVLAVLALIVTPLALLSAAVVMLTFLRQGWREGLLVVGAALAAMTGLGGLLLQMPIAAMLVGMMLWLPAAALGTVLGQTRSLRLAIEAAAVGAAVLVLAQHLFMADPTAFWREVLNEFLRQRVDADTLAQADAGALVEAVAGWMPGGVAASWLLGSIVSLLLARWWSSQLDEPGAFGREFRALRFGRWLLLLVPLLLVGGVLLTGGEPNMIAHLFLLGMVVFLVQGISVAHALVADFGASPGWLFGLYAVLVLIAPQGATMVAAAGYADGWLDLRTRARARWPRDGDE